MTPYWEDPDTGLQLYLGDMREILPALGLQADLVVADPPYAEAAARRPEWRAASNVLPLPANGSTTRPPGGQA